MQEMTKEKLDLIAKTASTIADAYASASASVDSALYYNQLVTEGIQHLATEFTFAEMGAACYMLGAQAAELALRRKSRIIQ